MKKFTSVFVSILIAIAISLGGISDAYAKRFGGGRSFGSRPSYSQPYSYNRTPAASPTESGSRQQTYTQNQPYRDAAVNKRSGLMGMLGGLALGGLLGSMLFGGGFHGVNMLDLLVFAGIAFLLFKLFAAKSARQTAPVPGVERGDRQYRSSYSDFDNPPTAASKQGSSANFDTDLLFGKNSPTAANNGEPLADSAAFDAPAWPQGFDSAAFLDGAKLAFKTLQAAWDRRDLAEIRGLTTDKVFGEIQEQLRAATTENRTEILKLDAELLDCREVGSDWEAVVLFDSIMREEREAQAAQVREVWHFVKPQRSARPTWFLDGIQQLEN